MPHRLVRSTLRRAVRPLALVALAAGSATAQSLPGDLVFSSAGGTIGDNRVTTFSVAVDAPGVLPVDGAITIRFRDFLDPAGADLFADLVFTPLGGDPSSARSIRLFDFAPDGYFGVRSFAGTYSFGSSFTEPLPGGAVPPGDYSTVGNLMEALGGRAIAGTYQIQVSDWFSNGGATVGGIDIAFDVGTSVSTVPEPGTVALVASGLAVIGGVAARRRRRATA